MKNRIKISVIILILILILSKPNSFKLFFSGFIFILIGAVIRFISAGCIMKNKKLASNCIYLLCRNPLYLGSFFYIFGISIQIINTNRLYFSVFLSSLIILLFYIIYHIQIKSEEKFLKSKFGEEFEEYCRKTPRFWPNINSIKNFFSDFECSISLILKNKEHKNFIAIFFIEIIIFLKILYAF